MERFLERNCFKTGYSPSYLFFVNFRMENFRYFWDRELLTWNDAQKCEENETFDKIVCRFILNNCTDPTMNRFQTFTIFLPVEALLTYNTSSDTFKRITTLKTDILIALVDLILEKKF